MPAKAEAVDHESIPHSAKKSEQTTARIVSDWQEEPWMSPNSWKIRVIRLAYRYRVSLWGVWWASLITAAVVTFFFSDDLYYAKFSLRSIRLLGESWVWALAGALGVYLLGSLLLIAIFGWFGVGFRYFAWATCLLCGTIVRLLRARWRGLILLMAMLFLAWVGYRTAEDAGLWDEGRQGSFGLWRVGAGMLALSLFVLAALLWGGYRTRRRIVVQPFKDLTGLPELQSSTQGLSERLCGELAGIAQLYRLINEIPGVLQDQIYSPAVDVLDVGDLLQGAASSEVSLDLKFLKIPIGPLMKLGGRLLHERWLTGSLHQQDGCLLLLARMSGGIVRNWKVEPGDLDKEDRNTPLPIQIDKMVQQLAYRIATDLVAIGSPKWRAVRSYTEGLRSYREVQRNEIDKFPRLRRAERGFLQALSEDYKFAQCHYNLGVVYREMEENGAAEAAFRRALQNNSEPSAACYALAFGYFNAPKYPEALWFTKTAIRIRPSDAQSWHLDAVTLFRYRLQSAIEEKRPAEDAVSNWDEVLETEEIAVALKWRDLCTWFARGPAEAPPAAFPLQDRRVETAAYTLSLAIADVLRGIEFETSPSGRLARWRRWERRQRGARVFRQASRLAPNEASHYFEWGRILFLRRELSAAALVFDRVFAGGLNSLEDRSEFWIYVLATHAALEEKRPGEDHGEIAGHAFGYVLDHLGIAGGDHYEEVLNGIQNAKQTLTSIQEDRGLGEEPREDLGTLLEKLRREPQENLASHRDRLDRLADERETGDTSLYVWRLGNLRRFLDELVWTAEELAPENLGRLEPGKETFFQGLIEDLDQARRRYEDAGKITPKFLDLLERRIAMQREDWEWVSSQAAVRLGIFSESRETQPANPSKLLADAVQRLESCGRGLSLQILELGLHAKLARAYLLEAEAARRAGDTDLRLERLRKGLTQAERGAALKPDGSLEHQVLGQIFLELGDYERADREWEISRFLRPDPKVLNLVGDARWRRGLELVCPQARRDAFRQAVRAFEHALELLESDTDGSTEARGQARFWLGVFHRELLHFDEAILHQKIAWSLGVRPLEARLNLAWSYLEAGMYAEAKTTFKDVLTDARQLKKRQGPATGGSTAGLGEEMPPAEVIVRACLGWALLYAEWGVRLRRAEKLLRQALQHVGGVRSYKRRELRARCYECLGWICHRRQQLEHGTEADLDTAFRHLCHAIKLYARSEGYWILAGIHLSRAEARPILRAVELERAREACERAQRTDMRGRRRPDIEYLLGRIEKAAQTPTAAAS
jgi:tetratricopeptide (TPR) repeat protein